MPRRFIVRIILTGGVLAAALLAVAGPALAKGASQVRITGPGLAHAIVMANDGEPDQSGQLATLAEQSGLFTAMFGSGTSGSSPAQLPTPPPQASLGPSYALVYTVPGIEPAPGQTDGTVRQDLYPYAHGGPLSYTPPGQRGFNGAGALRIQGWLRTSPELAGTLAQLGIQRPTGPAVKQATHGAAKDAPVPLIGLAATAAGVLAGVAWWLRRRTATSPS
jgi:hypothetical protein